jgi:hypothetical protein
MPWKRCKKDEPKRGKKFIEIPKDCKGWEFYKIAMCGH